MQGILILHWNWHDMLWRYRNDGISIKKRKKCCYSQTKAGRCREHYQCYVHRGYRNSFLARNPGEFSTPVKREREIITNILNDNGVEWFVAVYEGKVIGQCSVGLVRKSARYRHRAEVAFVILKEYWNLGIGGKMMEECIKWCKEKGVTQMELDVVKDNDKAIKMYRDFGFEITGTIPKALRYQDGTYADEYTMIKDI